VTGALKKKVEIIKAPKNKILYEKMACLSLWPPFGPPI
jgi:hypothetical protein